MRVRNALICLNMHAVELRCGDAGQKKINNMHLYCSEANWRVTVQQNICICGQELQKCIPSELLFTDICLVIVFFLVMVDHSWP